MTACGRNFVRGGCFFFTINLAERKLSLLMDHVELLRAAFREYARATIHDRGHRGIARSSWEHTIRHEIDFTREVDYVHINPSSMGSSTACATGSRPRFIVTWNWATTQPTGRSICAAMTAITESGDREKTGFARAQPILRVRWDCRNSSNIPAGREPPPGAARRPPPQAGEVQRVRGARRPTSRKIRARNDRYAGHTRVLFRLAPRPRWV
jgi:putative transposase